jgi:AmiR/NasT family two-component response regulator
VLREKETRQALTAYEALRRECMAGRKTIARISGAPSYSLY